MKNEKIPAVIEKSFKNTVWCKEILEGIGKHNFFDVGENGFCNLEENSVILIIGSSNYFLNSNINECTRHNLKAVVVGTDFNDSAHSVSSVVVDRASATFRAVKYFSLLGKVPIALFGISRYSSSDLSKKYAFEKAIGTLKLNFSEDDIYYFDEGSVKCTEVFLKNAKKYKSVICSNDYFATALVYYAAHAGIAVPDDLIIMGYGNSPIGEKVRPSLSTVAPKYRQMGIQAAKIYSYLMANKDVNSVNVFVDYDIIIRESTGKAEIIKKSSQLMDNFLPCHSSMFNDDFISKITALDAVIYNADETTMKILRGIVNDISYAKLAETLFLSDTALRYRLNKIFSMTYCSSRKELKELLQIIF